MLDGTGMVLGYIVGLGNKKPALGGLGGVMSEDQFYRLIGLGIGTPLVLFVLSTIKKAVQGWVDREGGIGRAVGKRVARLLKRVRNTTA